MLWFSITLECDAPVRFTEKERVFKGGIFHGMLESAITEYSRALYLALSGKPDSRRARYALFPPLDHGRGYRRGAQVKCGLVLFGAASAFWPEVISALLPQDALKLGGDRSPISVLKIDALHPNRIPRAIFSRDIGYIEDSPEAIEVATHSGNGTDSVVLRFLTPVTISSGAQRKLSLHAVPLSLNRCIKALRERVSELEPSLAADFAFETDEWISLEHGLREVTIVKADTKETLARLHLKLNPVKTRIVSFEQGFEFLGWNFVRSLAVPARIRDDAGVELPVSSATPKNVSAAEATGRSQPEAPMTGPMQEALREAMQHHADWKPGAEGKDAAPDILSAPGFAIEGDLDTSALKDAIVDSDDSNVVVIASEESGNADDTLSEPPALPAPGGIQRTLYVVHTAASLAKEGQRLQVRKDGEILLDLPAAQVDQVMIFGPNAITTPAMQLCLRNRIPITLLSRMGRYYGRIDAQDFSHLQLQQAQHHWIADTPRVLATAGAMVQGKLENSALLLSRYGRHRSGTVAEACQKAATSIRHISRRLRAAADLESLRGFEGAAARAYFEAWVSLCGPDWAFSGRERHPAPDPVNVLLSFGYTILYQCVAGLLQARGLNPHLGIFHTGTASHLALASDVMEEFRAVVVDACVLNLCLNGRLTRDQFRTAGGTCTLMPDAARLFIRALEDKFNSIVIYPNNGQKLDLRRIIDAQVQLLCKTIRHPAESMYEPCVFH